MKAKILGFVAVGLLAGPMAAHAGLIGDTVGIRLAEGAIDYGLQTPVVGAGEEGNYFSNQFFDFGDASFAIRSSGFFCGIGCRGETISLQLSSLDLGQPITSVLFSTSLTGVSVAFGSDFATFSWTDQSLSPETYLSARFVTGSVPEPGTLALLGLGLAGLGLSRRRKAA